MTFIVRTATRVICTTETEENAITLTRALNESYYPSPYVYLYFWEEEETEGHSCKDENGDAVVFKEGDYCRACWNLYSTAWNLYSTTR